MIRQWWFRLIVVVVIFGLFGCVGNDELEPEEVEVEELEEIEELEEPEEPEEPEITLIFIDETTNFAEWEYKVIDVELHKAIEDETARGQYIVALVEAENNAKMEREMGQFFEVTDEEDRVYSMDGSASLAHHHAYRIDTWYLEDIGPSFSAIVPFAFDVPEDVETLIMFPRDARTEDLNGTNPIIIYEKQE